MKMEPDNTTKEYMRLLKQQAIEIRDRADLMSRRIHELFRNEDKMLAVEEQQRIDTDLQDAKLRIKHMEQLLSLVFEETSNLKGILK